MFLAATKETFCIGAGAIHARTDDITAMCLAEILTEMIFHPWYSIIYILDHIDYSSAQQQQKMAKVKRVTMPKETDDFSAKRRLI